MASLRADNSRLRLKNNQLSRTVKRRENDLQFVYDRLCEQIPQSEVKVRPDSDFKIRHSFQPKTVKEALLSTTSRLSETLLANKKLANQRRDLQKLTDHMADWKMTTARRLAQKFENELIRISEHVCHNDSDDKST